VQWLLWGWHDTRRRTKQKFYGPKFDYSPDELAAVTEAILAETAADMNGAEMATKNDIFPSKYLKAADLKGKPIVLTITEAPRETLKYQGREESKIVLHFEGTKKLLPLNITNWDNMVVATGETDSDNWAGHKIEVFPTTTEMQGKTVECIRIRAPTAAPKKKAKTAKAVPEPESPKPEPGPEPESETEPDEPSSEMNDVIPF
jgi:hypothetical protein